MGIVTVGDKVRILRCSENADVVGKIGEIESILDDGMLYVEIDGWLVLIEAEAAVSA